MGYQIVKNWILQCLHDRSLSGSFTSDEYQVFWLKSDMRVNCFFEGKVNGQVTVAHETLADVIESNQNVQKPTEITFDHMFDIIERKIKTGGKYRLRFKDDNGFTFIPFS